MAYTTTKKSLKLNLRIMMNLIKKQPEGIKAGKFGYSGKMIIKSYNIPEERREDFLKVFYKNIDISINSCWEWKGRIHNRYGCFPEPGGNTKWAHRVSYALFNSRIKAQMHIDHICNNPKCVNPGHLRQVTPQENYRAIQRRKRRREKQLKEKMGQLLLW